jgi:hypothetical protein
MPYSGNFPLMENLGFFLHLKMVSLNQATPVPKQLNLEGPSDAGRFKVSGKPT